MGFWKRLFFPKKEYRSAAKAWIENPEKVQKSINRVLDTFFDSTLKELMPEKISLSLEPVVGLRIPEDKVKTILQGVNIRTVLPFNSVSEAMSQETQEAILEFAAGTITAPSKFFLMKVLGQSPIQEMFSLGLEKILVEFNRKLNPLAGMFQAAGFEKQISGFLTILLPSFTEKIAEMLHNSSESEAGKILISNTLKILFQTGFSDLGRLESTDLRKHLEKLRQTISSDPLLEKNMEKFYESFRDAVLNEYRGETLKEFLSYSDEEYIRFRDSVSKTTTENILVIHKQKPLTELVAGLLEDMLV
ncbi:hypothetical protein [Leptospira borgpetersenii]|uniref:Uncharacterized protein n=3 Tax=Leptospira TaxID=171 RepID=Q04NA7_LEPBJ|nr:hypothetical protein [Leptospira borgpetersenii]ABJ77613.1 Hypothetical protein LBJ_4234 [Leptospira borgpetersenii serovar Hardjo-bovis str. JB197]ABJ80558.1 Hypothetical protein LBL_4248 [Leptospira borgpetersenii serovar Hardjo-bovis str. L550]AMX60005.1 hypothetical protein LBK6_17340 [Leptospira borgpetersenii serovar Hardjo]AMX63235.1 hypothetical protein LBK9_17280 [Leptospira borgpetersenii serovar Hardjo]AMX66479.1 hypothetical protein LBK30_17270 [Leptospira borgpetersenii serovar